MDSTSVLYVEIRPYSELLGVLYVQFPLLQQQPEARERTWVVQRAVVRHPAQHGHTGGHPAHKTAQSPPLECQDGRTWPHTPGALCGRLSSSGGGGDWAILWAECLPACACWVGCLTTARYTTHVRSRAPDSC